MGEFSSRERQSELDIYYLFWDDYIAWLTDWFI